jgi:hypothetical protein
MSVVRDVAQVRALNNLWTRSYHAADCDAIWQLEDGFVSGSGALFALPSAGSTALTAKLHEIIASSIAGPVHHGTDAFEMKHLKFVDDVLPFRIYIYIQDAIFGDKLRCDLERVFDPVVVPRQEIDRLLDLLAWGLRWAISGCCSTGVASKKRIKDAVDACVNGFCGVGVSPSPCDDALERMQRAHLAALLIQRIWRRAMADPSMSLCKRRILKDSRACTSTSL